MGPKKVLAKKVNVAETRKKCGRLRNGGGGAA